MLLSFFKKLLKPQHPYAPVAYIGRKNFEKTMQCKVMKRKKLEKLAEETNSPQQES
ncbi:MAG: hypothetical protein WA981_13010 [Glaciecola sp.]